MFGRSKRDKIRFIGYHIGVSYDEGGNVTSIMGSEMYRNGFGRSVEGFEGTKRFRIFAFGADSVSFEGRSYKKKRDEIDKSSSGGFTRSLDYCVLR